MSFKRRIQYKYRNLLHAALSFRLPEWCESSTTRIAFLIAVAFFGTAYIVKTSAATGTGYEMHKLEKKVEALQIDNRKVQTEIAEYSSISNVTKRLGEVKMVSVGNVKHATVAGATVARK